MRRQRDEYRALRATIRERGTARPWIVLAGFVAWAGLVVSTAFLTQPLAALLPLLVLAVTFEIGYALHTGVERIGRYLQVFFEDEQTDRGWECQAMAYGRLFPGGGIDPLFTPYFVTASVFNLAPAVVGTLAPVEWAVLGAIHLLFIGRVLAARRAAAGQRAADLERFNKLKNRP